MVTLTKVQPTTTVTEVALLSAKIQCNVASIKTQITPKIGAHFSVPLTLSSVIGSACTGSACIVLWTV